MSCLAPLLLLVLELNEVNFPTDEHLGISEGTSDLEADSLVKS